MSDRDAPRCELHIRREGENDFTLPFAQAQVTLGRGADNAVVLKHDLASRHHALIEHRTGAFVLIDRNSSNGTRVNGQEIAREQPFPIHDGDEIGIAAYTITFRAAAAADYGMTMVGAATGQVADIVRDVSEAYAGVMDRPAGERTAAVRRALQERGGRLKPKEFYGLLEQLAGSLAGAADAATPSAARSGPAGGDPELYAVGLTALQRASDALLGPRQFRDAAAVERWVGLLRQFAQLGCGWLATSERQRQKVREALDLDVSRIGQTGVNPMDRIDDEAAAARLLLDWGDAALTEAAAAQRLTAVFENLTVMLAGAYKGTQQVVREMLQRIDPDRLEQGTLEKAGAAARIGVGLAAKSALWAELRRVHQELLAGKRWENDVLRIFKDAYRKASAVLRSPEDLDREKQS